MLANNYTFAIVIKFFKDENKKKFIALSGFICIRT